MDGNTSRSELLLLLMRAGSGLADRINSRVVEAGHPELRPAHGLVFVRASRGDATVSGIADYLGVTKQSAAAIVDQLTELGYLARSPHPTDNRATLIELSDKGRGVTEVASAAALEEWERLRELHGTGAVDALIAVLDDLGQGAAPRPVW
jgi:DNA-binding MarR family transcriptional regulator